MYFLFQANRKVVFLVAARHVCWARWQDLHFANDISSRAMLDRPDAVVADAAAINADRQTMIGKRPQEKYRLHGNFDRKIPNPTSQGVIGNLETI